MIVICPNCGAEVLIEASASRENVKYTSTSAEGHCTQCAAAITVRIVAK